MYKYITISMGYVNLVSTGTELKGHGSEWPPDVFRKDRKECIEASDRLRIEVQG